MRPVRALAHPDLFVLEATLGDLVRRAQADDPLARVAVVVPTERLAGHVRRRLAARCGALLVFRYLHRPLCAALAASLRPGGLLLYETFTTAQRELGYGPRNPAFLLEPGELPRLFPELEILETWEGLSPGPTPSALARLLARRPGD